MGYATRDRRTLALKFTHPLLPLRSLGRQRRTRRLPHPMLSHMQSIRNPLFLMCNP